MAKGVLSESEKQFFAVLNKGKPDDIKKYLNLSDVRTDCLDDSGMSPLCHAAYRGRSEVCSLLLLRGANVNSREHISRYTPLMFAVMSGSVETVHVLMAGGADAEIENSSGRTAAQLAGFISQHECAIVINSYVRRQDIDYFTVIRGFETEPKLPPKLAAPLHRFLLQTNLNLFWLAKHLMFNQDAHVLIDNGNHVHVNRVIDGLIERECKSQELNEMRAIKIHYLANVMQLALKDCANPAKNVDSDDAKGTLPEWLRNLVRPSVQDDFAKKTIGSFPYTDLALLRQLMHQIKTSPPQPRYSTAMSALLISIGGRMYDRMSASETCATCGARDAAKQCSKCHSVVYCDAECQKIHWQVHKKTCSEQNQAMVIEDPQPPPKQHPRSKAIPQCPFSSMKADVKTAEETVTGSAPVCPFSVESTEQKEPTNEPEVNSQVTAETN